jgi:hypothetical protein
MTGRRWVSLTITTVAFVACILAAIAYMIDPYGVWRSPAGRKLPMYSGSVRRTKLLMSKRYVPTNFDALIIGPSASANWNLPTVAGYRVYNESMEGANAAETQMVLNEALVRGHYKLTVFILAPILTSSHGVSDGLDQVGTSQAMWSIDLFGQEIFFVLHALHIGSGHVEVTAEGNAIFRKPKQMQPVARDASDFQIDPIALADYRTMIQNMQSRGAAIVYVIPPNYEPCSLLNAPRQNAYIEAVRAQLPPAPVVDLNGPEFKSLRSDSNNFSDCDHLEPAGADGVAKILEGRIPQAIARNQ